MSRSEPVKRKFSNGPISTEKQWYLIKYNESNEYSGIRHGQIKISKNDGDKGKITH